MQKQVKWVHFGSRWVQTRVGWVQSRAGWVQNRAKKVSDFLGYHVPREIEDRYNKHNGENKMTPPIRLFRVECG